MREKLTLIVPIALAVVVIDHLSKWWVDTTLAIGDAIAVCPQFFDIVHVRNFGAAFGFLADASDGFRVPFFYVTTIAALLFLIYYVANTPSTAKGTLTSLGLIFGGAVGNIADRIARGSVVDFLHLHWRDAIWTPTLFGSTYVIPLSWPSFNVADMAISVGVVLLLIFSICTCKPSTAAK